MPYNDRTMPYKRRNDAGASEKRTARIEVRAQPAREARIRYAASLKNQSVSAFILEAASAAAEDTIAESTETSMPSDQFDALWESLDDPPKPNKRLQAQAKKLRRFERR